LTAAAPIACIVQARMASTRLPGKVLKKVLGRPLLEYLLERLQRCANLDQVIVATTTNPSDDAIVRCAEDLHTSVFRGPEDDVLARYHGAAKAFGVTTIARVSADSPIIDPSIIDATVAFYTHNQERVDYVSNGVIPTFPLGMGCEVFSFRVLQTAHDMATDPWDREHVTTYIKCKSSQLRLGNVAYRDDVSQHRWTVDTQADFELVAKLLQELYPKNSEFDIRDILEVLDIHRDWVRINDHVEQRGRHMPMSDILCAGSYP